jgi:diguanylate cyclase (GGDEF)-like protein
MVDISVEMAQLEAMRDRERLLGRLAEALPIGICHLRPDGDVAYSNEPLTALLGPIDSVDTLVGRIASEDRQPVELALERALLGQALSLEVGMVCDVEERRCELTFRALTSDSGSVDGVILCVADVTDRSRLRSELEHRASHDALSGCLNRAATVAALERALREWGQVAVAYLDLDHFKAVNDRFGHAAGDELLRVAAARLRGAIRGDDQIGRIGGDEFVVICRQGHGDFDASALVDRLANAINGDVMFAEQRIPLRASVGAAVSEEGEVDAEAVLTRADAAMYEAKRRSRVKATGLRAVSAQR